MARAHGVDISKWQVSFDASVNPDDIQFIIMRASIGIMPDPIFDQLYDSILPIPVRGAYHFFRSEWDWKEQADHFLGLVKDRKFHFFALDVETVQNQRSATFANGAQRWMEHVAGKSQKKVLLYTNPIVYKTWLKPYGNWMSKWPFWIAQYWFEPDRNKKPGLPEGVTEWKFWQYSADGNYKGREYGVQSRHIDLDVFNGTEAEMRRWLGLPEAHGGPSAPTTTGAKPPDLPEGLDLDQLARKLAPLVAPLVANLVRPGGSAAGGVSFGLPGQTPEPPGLETITGIGSTFRNRLLESGIGNVRSLAFLGAAEVAEVLSVSLEQAQNFIDQARRLAGPPE